MASGWKFSVSVPSWTQTTLERDELVTFYKVEVTVLPPEGKGPPKIRSVLRRYNHFTKLHNKLITELGAKKMMGRDVPGRRSLFSVNKRPELIERRKKELQQWMWKLVSDPSIARSKALNEFLELADAARIVTRPPPSRRATTTATPESVRGGGSYAMSEGSSPRGDASSEASGFTSASMLTEGPSSFPHLPAADLPLERSSTMGSSHLSMPMGRQNTRSVVEDGGAGSPGLPGGGGGMRLGLHVEQRGDLKQVVRTLKMRLDAASSDLQDAVQSIYTEREAKRQLAERIACLEGQASSDREAEFERLLSQVREIDALIGQPVLAQARPPSAETQGLLEEAARKQQVLRAEVESLRGSVDGTPDSTRSDEAARATARALEELREAKAAVEQQIEELTQRHAQESQAAAASWAAKEEAARQLLDDTKQKAKADMKLLAKEVKLQRKLVTELEQRVAAAEGKQAAGGQAREAAAGDSSIKQDGARTAEDRTASGAASALEAEQKLAASLASAQQAEQRAADAHSRLMAANQLLASAEQHAAQAATEAAQLEGALKQAQEAASRAEAAAVDAESRASQAERQLAESGADAAGVEGLRTQIAEAEKRAAEFQAEAAGIKGLKSQIADADKRAAELQAEVVSMEGLRMQIAEAEKRTAELEAEVASIEGLKIKIVAAEERAAKLEAEVASMEGLKAQITASEKRAAELEAKASGTEGLRAQIAEAEKRVAELEQELAARSTRENGGAGAGNQDLVARMEEAEAKLREEVEGRRVVEAERQEAVARAEEARRETEEWQEEAEDARSAQQAAEASLAEAQAKASERHSQLAQELEEALRNGTAASSRAQELERQVAESQTRIQEGEANLRALTANQGEFMDTYADMERAKEAAEARVQKLESEAAAGLQRAKSSGLNARLERAEEECLEAEARTLEAEARAEEAAARIAELEGALAQALASVPHKVEAGGSAPQSAAADGPANTADVDAGGSEPAGGMVNGKALPAPPAGEPPAAVGPSDPFAGSGGLDLFSGLSLSPQPAGNSHQASPLSSVPLEPGLGSGSFLSGVDDHPDLLLGPDPTPLDPLGGGVPESGKEVTLLDAGFVAQSSGRLSSGNLSWDEDAAETPGRPSPQGAGTGFSSQHASPLPPAAATTQAQSKGALPSQALSGPLAAGQQNAGAGPIGSVPAVHSAPPGTAAPPSAPHAEPGSSAKGSLLNTFGSWGNTASQSRVATGLQGMLGNTHNLEIPSFARNLIRKSGNPPADPKRAPKR